MVKQPLGKEPDKPLDLTVVMYHWIRPQKDAFYPRRNGRSEEAFSLQLDWLRRNYTIVGLDEVIGFFDDGEPLPDRACLLTFDDGHLEHYTVAFPLLAERGLPATFFPCSAPIFEGRLLDTHRVHLILAARDSPKVASDLLQQILHDLYGERPEDMPEPGYLIEKYMRPGTFDPPEACFVKRVCDTGLPENLRRQVIGRLFEMTIDQSEHEISMRFYMDLSQLQVMSRAGMIIGPHGHNHIFLNTLDEASQAQDIDASLELLRRVYGRMPDRWAMCYPFGSCNETTLKLLAARGCSIAFIDQPGSISRSTSPLMLPRTDTNYIGL